MFNHIQDYETLIKFDAEFAGTKIQVISKPGFPSWDKISPAQGLLAEFVNCSNYQKLLMFNVGHGAAAVILAGKLPLNSIVYLIDPHYNAIQCTEKTLFTNNIHNFSIINTAELHHDFIGCIDAVVIDIPKGRRLFRRWVLEAFNVLTPLGALYVVGANNQGIQSAIKDAKELFGIPQILGYRKGNRLVKFNKPKNIAGFPLWSQEAGVTPGSWFSFLYHTAGVPITFHTLPGVFSSDAIDEGTQLLLQNFPSTKGKKVLDVGCGYGILGITAALNGREEGMEASVDLIDNNLLAVACTKKNIEYHAIRNANVFPSDLLSAVSTMKYQLIVSNPPFHAGLEIDYSISSALIKQASQALEPGGQLIIVANHFLRYDQIMRSVLTSVDIRARNNKFHVIEGIK